MLFMADAVVVSMGLAGNWFNLASDIVTLTTLIIPSKALSHLVTPVATMITLSGIMVCWMTVWQLKILKKISRESSETRSNRMRFMVEVYKNEARDSGTSLGSIYPNLENADPRDEHLSEHREWKTIFDTLLPQHQQNADHKGHTNDPGAWKLPSLQCEALINAINGNERERETLIINTTLLCVAVMPMFIIKAVFIMSFASERVIRGWIFRISLFFGAILIGVKIAQGLGYVDFAKASKLNRKQLYLLITSVKSDAFTLAKGRQEKLAVQHQVKSKLRCKCSRTKDSDDINVVSNSTNEGKLQEEIEMSQISNYVDKSNRIYQQEVSQINNNVDESNLIDQQEVSQISNDIDKSNNFDQQVVSISIQSARFPRSVDRSCVRLSRRSRPSRYNVFDETEDADQDEDETDSTRLEKITNFLQNISEKEFETIFNEMKQKIRTQEFSGSAE